MPSPTLLSRITAVLTIALAVRGFWLHLQYSLQWNGVQRHHVETAILTFLLVGAVGLATRTRLPAEPERGSADSATTHQHWSWWEPAIWCACAIALYARAVPIGLLSDDFVLAERARAHSYGFVHGELFRPLPLMLWSVILPLAGPTGLHLLNATCHGLVAFATTRVVRPFVNWTPLRVCSGGLVLAFPGAIEAVMWNSAVFDVLATLLALAAILTARQYGEVTSLATRAQLLALVLAALASKETAFVVPILIALDAWARRQRTKPLWLDLGAALAVFALLGAIRVSVASSFSASGLSKYVVQRWAFGTVSGVAVPWHSDTVTRYPLVPAIYAGVILLLIATFLVSRATASERRGVAFGSLWILVGSLPTLPFFYVAPDLQGSRYLYLPAVGFALVLSLVAGTRGRFGDLRAGLLVLLVLFGGVVGWQQQRPWPDAAAARDEVLAAIRRDERLQRCATAIVTGLPDAVRGAYVFRNGAEIAFKELGVTVGPPASGDCAFEWRPELGAFGSAAR